MLAMPKQAGRIYIDSKGNIFHKKAAFNEISRKAPFDALFGPNFETGLSWRFSGKTFHIFGVFSFTRSMKNLVAVHKEAEKKAVELGAKRMITETGFPDRIMQRAGWKRQFAVRPRTRFGWDTVRKGLKPFKKALRK